MEKLHYILTKPTLPTRIMTSLRISGEGKLGDEMELPLVDPRDPNYDSDRHEAVVKISTLNSLILIGSG